jgi:hypothetical protein
VVLDGEKESHPVRAPLRPEDLTYSLLFQTFIMTMSVVVARKEHLLKAGLFDESLRASVDRDLYLRMTPLGEFAKVPEELVVKVNHEGSVIRDFPARAAELSAQAGKFFSSPGNSGYAHLENKVRAHTMLRLARENWTVYRNFPFIASMISSAAVSSPGYTLEYLVTNLFALLTRMRRRTEPPPGPEGEFPEDPSGREPRQSS